MIALTKSKIALLAVVGVMVAALLGLTVESVAGEKVLMSDTAANAGYQLAPNGKQAEKADATSADEAPGVAEIGPDGKVRFVSGKKSGGGSGTYTANNSGSRKGDD
ncbi:MAG: hypothetical protein NTX07_03085 [Solirubrobacterales bacterium]|nr:hypothetical protein [Solirubrobacterales bacterium]